MGLGRSRAATLLRGPAAGATFLLLLAVGAAAQDLRDPRDYLRRNGGAPPENGAITICHAYGCGRTTRIRLDDADLAMIRRMMAPGAASAEAERVAVAYVIAAMETKVGAMTGTSADRDYRDLASGGDPTQMDCIDEAANSTSYLLLLDQLGLLRHHGVAYPASKGFLIDFVYPHNTAVLAERATGRRYAVDSWVFRNGEKPIVVPLETWYATRSASFYRQRHGV
ncbi:MAG: hypothetical protein Q8P46_13440 [Hyphomicrobiales bacterium]|nr:hypothetical protein [Hyphomicrobiales bacterium]